LVSAFYVMFGGLTILALLDVRRFGAVITYLAIITMGSGVVMTGVDAVLKIGLDLRGHWRKRAKFA
jgi:hypothetical protein